MGIQRRGTISKGKEKIQKSATTMYERRKRASHRHQNEIVATENETIVTSWQILIARPQ